MTRQMMFVGLLVLSSIYGVARGGRPEQIGAATLALGVLASIVFSHPVTRQFQRVEVGMLAVDAAMLGVFLWLSFKSTRFWPAWVSGMLMAEVAVHVMRVMVPDVVPKAYMDAVAIWSWVAQVILIVATRRHQRRLHRQGADRSWRN
jgi:hypothetical protein